MTTVHFVYERMMYTIGPGTQLWAERHAEDPLVWILMATNGHQDIPLIFGSRNTIDQVMMIIARALAQESPYVIVETEPYDHIKDGITSEEILTLLEEEE